MSEKRGETEKLINPFNTAGVLEVYMPSLQGWYRVTARDFRSFDGERRITEPTTVEQGNVAVETLTYEYLGPIFMFGTNVEVPPSNQGKLVTGEIWDKALEISGSRK